MIKNSKFVIGVDAGATKTLAVLADENGKILKEGKGAAASLRDNGIDGACESVATAIAKLLVRKLPGEIVSTYIGFPAMAEEFKKRKKEIIGQLAKNKRINIIFKGKVNIDSDQLVAYRAGTDSKDGIVAIAGTGCVVRGWHGEKEVKVSGWGWLSNEGSAFWIGKKVFLAILKSYDGREQKTLLTDMVFKEFRLKNIDNLMTFVYKKPAANLPLFAKVCDDASQANDGIASQILHETGQEIASSVLAAAKQLNFPKDEEITLVAAGGVFKAHLAYYSFEVNLKKEEQFDFAISRPDLPVTGAVKLALESVK
ncbi:MAG TPA: BadF/BadG/BcrA/BcrD ATPase family protein [Candidatus Paceibacterota bacterium]|nr:BadF/BadG/BcrA/BcrD ATPase family protein [Candidatus Pacearchaeota archaeon]HRZ50726.1 BadF/BadG/BcrA/BcrD ATPase family protein [Candidatus Paceibacterota bacterium]HSA36377.1 BadF/BadG/BcrA/BcrD ATPase family protein [Candidatus Paceibacterota bacterium]